MGEPGYARHLSPDRRPYQTSDGYLCALVYNDKQWQSFVQAVGQPELLTQFPYLQRFETRAENIDAVNEMLSRLFLTRTTAQWIELLEAADIPYMTMHTLHSVIDDPHLESVGFFEQVEHPTEGLLRQMRVPVTWQRTPAEVPRHAPRLGEHTREVLREIGLADSRIDALHEAAVVCSAPDQP